MKKLLFRTVVIGLVSVPGTAQAQMSVGPMAGYHDDLEAFGVGAFLSIDVPSIASNLSIVPSFVFYFPDNVDAFEVNGDVMYAFRVSPDTPVLPFAFAGLNVVRSKVDVANAEADTDVGLNLGGGVTFRAASVEPFAGAKFEIHDGTAFLIFGGIGFPIG